LIVQIYEIQTPQEAEKCLELGVDHIGSVLLSPEDWKRPELKDVMQVCRGTHGKNTLIPLFSDPDVLYRAVEFYEPDFIHFCDKITESGYSKEKLDLYRRRQSALKRRFPETGVIRSIPIPEEASTEGIPSLSIAGFLEADTDIFLTDTWVTTEPVSGYIGLTGKTVDRPTAASLVDQSEIPVILAGGLSPQNVFAAVMDILPAGADSCSWTNLSDDHGNPIRFRKDFLKVESFVKEVRRAEDALDERREAVNEELEELRAKLSDREAALPAHSVKPQQMMVIEEIEDAISQKEKALHRIDRAKSTPLGKARR